MLEKIDHCIGTLFICSMPDFTSARLKFFSGDVLFSILLATMMVPLRVMIISELLIMLPLVVLYSFAQKYFVKGITLSGLKA